MYHTSIEDPEFINAVINHIDSNRRAGNYPYETSFEGYRVDARMPHLAVNNIQLLHDMHQLAWRQVGNRLEVTVKGMFELENQFFYVANVWASDAEDNFDDEGFYLFFEEYLSFLAVKLQKGDSHAMTCMEYYAKFRITGYLY